MIIWNEMIKWKQPMGPFKKYVRSKMAFDPLLERFHTRVFYKGVLRIWLIGCFFPSNSRK